MYFVGPISLAPIIIIFGCLNCCNQKFFPYFFKFITNFVHGQSCNHTYTYEVQYIRSY